LQVCSTGSCLTCALGLLLQATTCGLVLDESGFAIARCSISCSRASLQCLLCCVRGTSAHSSSHQSFLLCSLIRCCLATALLVLSSTASGLNLRGPAERELVDCVNCNGVGSPLCPTSNSYNAAMTRLGCLTGFTACRANACTLVADPATGLATCNAICTAVDQSTRLFTYTVNVGTGEVKITTSGITYSNAYVKASEGGCVPTTAGGALQDPITVNANGVKKAKNVSSYLTIHFHNVSIVS
jgi:hypothetical protein